jgi:hypothetical protein
MLNTYVKTFRSVACKAIKGSEFDHDSCHYITSKIKLTISSVAIVRSYRLDVWGVRGKIFLHSTASIPALEPTQPPIQWLPEVKRPKREADYSSPSNGEVKNGGAIPPIASRQTRAITRNVDILYLRQWSNNTVFSGSSIHFFVQS